MRLLIFLLFLTSAGFAQTNTYTISFSNAEHHEAIVKVNFSEVR